MESPSGSDESVAADAAAARVAFKEMLKKKDIEGLGWMLGQLAVHTADNVAKMNEDEWQNTLALIPAKRHNEVGDLADPNRFAPGHFSLLRQLREEVLREATLQEPAAPERPVVQPSGQSGGGSSPGRQEAERTASHEAVTSLNELEAYVSGLLEPGPLDDVPPPDVISDITEALEYVAEATQHISRLSSAPPAAAAALNCMKQAAKCLEKRGLKHLPAVKKVERCLRDVIVLRCHNICVDPLDREQFKTALGSAFFPDEVDDDLKNLFT